MQLAILATYGAFLLIQSFRAVPLRKIHYPLSTAFIPTKLNNTFQFEPCDGLRKLWFSGSLLPRAFTFLTLKILSINPLIQGWISVAYFYLPTYPWTSYTMSASQGNILLTIKELEWQAVQYRIQAEQAKARLAEMIASRDMFRSSYIDVLTTESNSAG